MKQKSFKISEGILVQYQRSKTPGNAKATDPTNTAMTTVTTGMSKPFNK